MAGGKGNGREIRNFPKLKDFPKPAKIAVFFFSLYCIFGPFVNLGYHVSKVGVGFNTMLSYYMGSEEEMIPPKGASFFFEVMHFHTWSQSSILLILSLLFSLSSAGYKLKLFFIPILFLSSFGHIFFPIMTRFVSKIFVYPLFIATLFLSASIILMALFILKDSVSSSQKR